MGRKPIGERAMTNAEYQARHRKKVALENQKARQHSPNPFPGIMNCDEMLAKLGWNVPTMSQSEIAALRALPGGNEPFDPDDEQPALDEFGEPIDSP